MAMKTIGLIGGMSWESTTLYYQWINQGVKKKRGGLHSARISMYSVDFHQIERLQHAGQWDELGEILADAAQKVEAAGADFLLLCTNTMHKVAPAIEQAVSIPLIHIADATGQRCLDTGKNKPALLGTDFTMSDTFYTGRMTSTFGIQCLLPDKSQRDDIHRIIYQELCLGIISPESRKRYVEIVNSLADQGADSVILGCTEITLLIGQEDVSLEVLDTTAIHAQAAIDLALM